MRKIDANLKCTLIFTNIIITCIASSMLATALTTALPSIITEFDVGLITGQWLTSGYSLAMGIIMPLTAYLISRFPTRRLYLSAIICFICGLILCVIAPNFPILMVGRILQACGNGILTSMSQVILLTIYPVDKRGSVMGWYGLSIGAAPVIAPTLAGFLIDTYGWRMIFYAAITIMFVSLAFAACVFDDVLDVSNKKFDVLSFGLSALAFGGITLSIGNIGNYPFVSVQVLLILIVGLAAAGLFIYRQLHLQMPFLELRILQNKPYAISVISSMLLYLIMMGASIIIPLYVQTIRGYSAMISGLVILPGSLTMAILSPFTGKIYDKIGIKPLFVIGSLCMIASNIAMALVTMQTPIWLPAVYNVIRSAAIGCLMMPLITWGTSYIERGKTSHATALLTSLRTIAGAIGSAIFVSIMTIAANNLYASYGDGARIYGLSIAFGAMSLSNFVLVLIAVFGVRQKK